MKLSDLCTKYTYPQDSKLQICKISLSIILPVDAVIFL